MLLTKEEAKTKCCPFTLNIPSIKAREGEYVCLGDQCMAWIWDIDRAHVPEKDNLYQRGSCYFFRGGK